MNLGGVAQAFKLLLLSLGMILGAPSFATQVFFAPVLRELGLSRKGWEIITRGP